MLTFGGYCLFTRYNAGDLFRSVTGKTFSACYVATRHNGVAAAEKAWTDSIWEDTGLDKAWIEETFAQNQELLICYPVLP